MVAWSVQRIAGSPFFRATRVSVRSKSASHELCACCASDWQPTKSSVTTKKQGTDLQIFTAIPREGQYSLTGDQSNPERQEPPHVRLQHESLLRGITTCTGCIPTPPFTQQRHRQEEPRQRCHGTNEEQLRSLAAKCFSVWRIGHRIPDVN